MRYFYIAVLVFFSVAIAKANTQVHVVLDTSGSMHHKLPAISRALENLMASDAGQQSTFTFYSFTDKVALLGQDPNGNLLHKINTLRVTGGVEDGYVPVRKVLTSDTGANAFLLLFTDEDRDLVQDIALRDLIDLAKTQHVEIHVLLNQTLNCASQPGFAFNALGFSVDIDGENIDCQVSDFNRQPTENYLPLALETGGMVWNINAFYTRTHGLDTEYSARQAERAVQGFNRIMQQRLEQTQDSQFSFGVDVSGLTRVGESVYFDASRSEVLSSYDEIIEWRWDLDGDGEIDDVGSQVSWNFSHNGRHSVYLTLVSQRGITETQSIVVDIEH